MRSALDRLRARYANHAWTRVDHGESGAEVWRLGGTPDLFAKLSTSPLAGEAARLAWLGQHGIPVPEVVETDDDGVASWLVTTAVPGRPASAPWPATDRGRVVDAVADITRTLHRLAIDTCPFDRTLRHTIAAARHAAARGEIDLDDLDDDRAGSTAAQLLAELEATTPVDEDLAVCHGDLCLPNVIIDPHTLQVSGLVDVGRLGLADRYTDLALVDRSLGDDARNAQFGPTYAARFLAGYGEIDIDDERLAFYRLLDEFC